MNNSDSSGPLGDLERRYDGPVPAMLRRRALAGGLPAMQRNDALARSALYDRLARHAVAAMARQRHRALMAGKAAPAHADLAGQLSHYRAAGLCWRDLAPSR